MAVPSSGQLRLRADINLEVEGNDTDDNVSLGALSDAADLTTPPDQMSEFYGYVAYTTPTFSGSISTSNVYDVRMDVASPTYGNPSGGNVERGFYFGTSSTATNNTFYSLGSSSATSGSFSKQFTGLSGSTTYYIWAVIRDTQSPARFTEVLSSLKAQSTLAAVSYSTYTMAGVRMEWQAVDSIGTQCWSGITMQYNHTYYGYTTQSSAQISGTTTVPTGVWEGATTYSYSQKITYRSAAATANRMFPYVRIAVPTSQYGGLGEAQVTTAMTNSISGSNYFNMLITGKTYTSTGMTGNANFSDPYNNNNQYMSTSPRRSTIDGNGGANGYSTGYIQFNA